MNDPLEEGCLRRMEESRGDEPQYPGSIEGDPTERDRLREENARLKSAVEVARKEIQFAYETLNEINPSNYDHDDVSKLNNEACAVIVSCAKWLAANPEEK